MNILHTIYAKVATVITAILISVGIWSAPVPPTPIQPAPEVVVETPAIPEVPRPVPEKPVVKAPAPKPAPPQISATSTAEVAPISPPVPTPTPTPPPQVIYVPVYVPQPTPAPTPQAPTPEPIVEAKPKPVPSKASIAIISPIAGKGIGPRMDFNGTDVGYVASSTVENESNYIVLGLIVYDDAGENTRTAVVTVTATDASQNKTMNGTGNQKTMYYDGIAKVMWFYPFSYDFRFAGQHTITFSANGMTESVTLTVK